MGSIKPLIVLFGVCVLAAAGTMMAGYERTLPQGALYIDNVAPAPCLCPDCPKGVCKLPSIEKVAPRHTIDLEVELSTIVAQTQQPAIARAKHLPAKALSLLRIRHRRAARQASRQQ
jgi:hypothetical protein